MQTIEKAIEVLECFLNHKNEYGLMEVANLTRLNVTTAHRICSVLVKRGYLYQQRKRGKYSIGFKLLPFNNIRSIYSNLKDIALPYLKELSSEVSETSVITILEGNKGFNLVTCPSEQILTLQLCVGNSIPLHCTSNGKILLAYARNETVEAILDNLSLVAFTPNTITNLNQLRNELTTIKENGIAFDDEEFAIGVRSVAVPIRIDSGDVIAAISFAGASVRISRKRMIELSPVVKEYGLKISRALRYKGK